MSKRGRPFQPGNQFGRGRPAGSRNKKSLVLQEMLFDRSREVMLKVIGRAKEGDPVALKLCVERLIPRLKDVEVLPVEQSQKEDPGVNIIFRDTDGKEIDMNKPAKPGPMLVGAENEQSGSSGHSGERGEQRTPGAMPSEDGQTTSLSGQTTRKPVVGERLRNPDGNTHNSPWS